METPKNILIIIDAQNDFIIGNKSSITAIKNISNYLYVYGSTYDYIITTQDTHDIQTYYSSKEGQIFPIHCVKNTEGWKIDDIVLKTISKIVKNNSKCLYSNIEKHNFGYINWPFYLKENTDTNLNQIITIMGLKTDICVITNALILKTLYPKAEIILRTDCCAGTTPEAHAAALQIAKNCQITIY